MKKKKVNCSYLIESVVWRTLTKKLYVGDLMPFDVKIKAHCMWCLKAVSNKTRLRSSKLQLWRWKGTEVIVIIA
jgi:hypothetical protein